MYDALSLGYLDRWSAGTGGTLKSTHPKQALNRTGKRNIASRLLSWQNRPTLPLLGARIASFWMWVKDQYQSRNASWNERALFNSVILQTQLTSRRKYSGFLFCRVSQIWNKSMFKFALTIVHQDFHLDLCIYYLFILINNPVFLQKYSAAVT